MYQDREAEIEAAVVAANAHWHEAMVAHADRRYRLRNEHSAENRRWASLARRLTWIPAERDLGLFQPPLGTVTHDLADAVLATPAGPGRPLSEQGA